MSVATSPSTPASAANAPIAPRETAFSATRTKIAYSTITTTGRWLPLASPWPAPNGINCNDFLYHFNHDQLDEPTQTTETVTAYPPWLASFDVPAGSCLPSEAGYQHSVRSKSSISLGPTFVCPEAYTTATSSWDAPNQMESIECCPSDYQHRTSVIERSAMCMSSIAPQGTYTILHLDEKWSSLEASLVTVTESDLTVVATPLTGYKFEMVSGQRTMKTTTTATTIPTTTSEPEPTSEPSTSKTNIPPMSPQAKLALALMFSIIGVGMVLGLAILFIVIMQRRKRLKRQSELVLLQRPQTEVLGVYRPVDESDHDVPPPYQR